MWFSVTAERRWFMPESFGFTLRCLRETPRPLLGFRSGIEQLAKAELVGIEFDGAKSVYCVVFALPSGLPGSDLLAEEPVYWELTVDGDGAFAGLRGRIFIPVNS